MLTVAKKEELLKNFNDLAVLNIKENVVEDLSDFMKGNDATAVHAFCKKVQNNIVAAIPRELVVPKTALYVTSSGEDGGDAINVVSICISNKYNAVDSFKFKEVVTSNDANSKVIEFLLGVYSELLVNEMAKMNVLEINAVLGRLVEEAGVNYSVSVVTALGNNGKKISQLTDDSVVFVADEDRVFDLEDILLFTEPDDSGETRLTTDAITNAFKSEASLFATALTPIELVEKKGGTVIKYICDISNQVKPLTLIKKICTKKVEFIRGDKDTLAFNLSDGVFTLLAKRDGHYEVVLSPFDISTFRFVEKDILKELSLA